MNITKQICKYKEKPVVTSEKRGGGGARWRKGLRGINY